LADFCQHIPKARQHQVSYAGYFANALSKLKPGTKSEAADTGTAGPSPGSKSSRWAALVLRTWAVDPELCPRCGNTMKRSRPLRDRTELERLLNNLNIGKYPTRPRSPPPPDLDEEHFDDTPPDTPTPWPDQSESQVPPGWDEWDAA
jgi:hypothetical protein